MKKLHSIMFGILLSAGLVFAEQADASSDAEAAAPVSASAEVAGSSETDLRQEIALRDSVMAVRDSSCTVEKDSLRNSLELEQAKCENWEKSYNTIKKNNEVCAQALKISIDINEKNQEKVDDERKKAAMMTSTSFISGVGLGMLLFWLIF